MNQTEYVDVLYSEDEPDIRELGAFTLRFAGYSVVSVGNGEEVINLLFSRAVLPKLVILDVRTPKITGYEACRIIKANPLTKHIPVIFLSAKGQDSEIAAGLDAGAVAYYRKPYLPDQLVEAVKKILNNDRLGVYKE